MNLKTSLFLAFNSIKRGNKGTLFMTILIMTLAYINLVFVASIFGGIVQAINNEAINNQYSNIVITPAVDDIYIKKSHTEQRISSLPGVDGVAVHYVNQSIIEYDKNKDGDDIQKGHWTIKSITPKEEEKVTDIYKSMVAGSYLKATDRDQIIIGRDISGGYGSDLEYLSLGVKVGDQVDVYFSNGIERTYTVKGIFKTKNTQVNQSAFITKGEMESVLHVYNWSSEILVKTKSTNDESMVIKEIRESGFKTEDIKKWSDLMGFTSGASKSFDMISIILGAIGTIVAGITIFIIIFVSVVNKRKQIGILKAIGMREGTIVAYFVIQALFYGLVGVLLGVSLILFVIRPLFISNPLDFPIGWVSLKITFNIIRISNLSLLSAALIGGFFPAYKGAKRSILNSIWG